MCCDWCNLPVLFTEIAEEGPEGVDIIPTFRGAEEANLDNEEG